VYLFGGYTGTSYLDTILSFTPSTGPSQVGTLAGPLSGAAAVSYNGDVYVIGGSAGRHLFRSIYRFNPASKTATKIGELPYGLTGAAAATVGDEIIVAGGDRADGGNQSDAILGIDPASGRVTTLGKLPVPVGGASAVTLGDAALVLGGQEPSGQANASIYRVAIEARKAGR
jgi:N-acetylneuraminic acid mutarotase